MYMCVFACMYVAFPLSAHKSVVSVRVYAHTRVEASVRICLLVCLFVCFADVGVERGGGGGVGGC